MNYRTAVLKRNVELVLMFPFVFLGKLAGKIFTLNTPHNIFLFFPSGDLGGSIKVNAEIAECIKDHKPLIIFSKKPKNNGFIQLFNIEGVRIIDLHKYVDNKLYHFINFFFRGVLSSWINSAKNPVIFGGESMFFFKIVPHVRKKAKIIELCHLNTWFNYSLAFIDFIDIRIFSSHQIKRDAEKIYEANNLPNTYYDKLIFIVNKIDIPNWLPVNNDILQVVFVGRGAPQKRVHLIAEIARAVHKENLPIHFSFVGDVKDLIPQDVQAYTTLFGNIDDKSELNKIYQKSDVLILTSLFEGLPIVVMEMMARGKIILSTAVGGIPDYIDHLNKGFLIYETDEQKIVSNAVDYLLLILRDENLRTSIGRRSYEYAVTHFGGEKFCNSYRKILLANT
ncbi:MAG: glycosyltransferase family 4 protein [Flavipsychrobacter sp.]